ncbi:hypothetical protein PRZ48_001102 [Zasmidium cellare]|uniref:Uncharacterized protein n=1 Tax=Zasmidium cellare TaxID=395010 RepID=A0ABR0F0W2_ZASCE|nr:hypothetical protein PRZ48_001102 [Zasmidium cellare]
MASKDPHQGGDLSDMAVDGTKVPNDAGKQNLIPSVPRPDQQAENPQYHNQFINAADPQGAVDNATDIPRQFKDMGATGEVITGIGDQLPPQIESKRLHNGPNDSVAKGHDRVDKHRKQQESDLERYQGAGAAADPAPGDEQLSQDQLRDRKGI